VEEIFACKGRVIITGVGKSALIAQKIVATFNSTGTPALYMHAADAVHGDLGMITGEDCIICLSKSGETAEIKVLIPILKNFGNKLIGMTANKQSYLGQNVDYLLHIPVTREAEPNRLAPTASSLAQMAMGDALASALLKIRGFSHEHFARFHPGGSLGKQLYLRIKDVYPNNEIPSVGMDAPIGDVIIEMTSKRLGVAVVLDDRSKIKGIITDGDLRRMLNKYKNSEDLRAGDIMSVNPKTIGPSALAVEAFRIMQKNSITQIIVTENDQYLGIVHIHDLIREGIV
jgi:arabinose-5-phosphate isomerase